MEIKGAGISGNYSRAAKRIMALMGWKEGLGLGKKGQGIKEPIKAVMRPGRRLGLGAEMLKKIQISHRDLMTRFPGGRRNHDWIKFVGGDINVGNPTIQESPS